MDGGLNSVTTVVRIRRRSKSKNAWISILSTKTVTVATNTALTVVLFHLRWRLWIIFLLLVTASQGIEQIFNSLHSCLLTDKNVFDHLVAATTSHKPSYYQSHFQRFKLFGLFEEPYRLTGGSAANTTVTWLYEFACCVSVVGFRWCLSKLQTFSGFCSLTDWFESQRGCV